MKRILFIEDEKALQKTFGDIFEQGGYEVIGALDGEQGLELAKKEKPDLILLDLILPRMHGLEVLKELKKKPKEVEKAVELGATTYLVKTAYSLKEIIEKVKKVIGS